MKLQPSIHPPPQESAERLKLLSLKLLQDITGSVSKTPIEMRIIGKKLYQIVNQKFKNFGEKALSAYLLLRFFVPGLCTPEKIIGADVSPDCRRTLTLIAKILQSFV